MKIQRSLINIEKDTTITRARDLSFQDRATRDPESGSLDILSSLVRAGETISPWWSTARDRDLRAFWKQSDHVAGAIYALSGKVSAMGFKILPRDKSVLLQNRMAEEAFRILVETPEYGAGWQTLCNKIVQDDCASDNGWFVEIIGAGAPDGPRVGRPVSLAHMDSAKCQRTSSPEYPVIYRDTDGKCYRIHYTRVMLGSQLPSPDVEMNSVGYCAVGRCIGVAQGLIDISRFKQEKLGSRPARMLLIGKKGISAAEILLAFAKAGESMDSAGLARFAKIVALAPKDGRGEIDLDLIDLASIPDGFDEQTSTTLGMFTIALAFGVDARELWPATVSGATKADAMIQHLKARGKGPGQIQSSIQRQINQKFLPPSLRFEFDMQDDEEDMLAAEIRQERSTRHERDINAGIITIRTVREQMLDDGDMTEAQFEQEELESGRLRDGSDLLSIFHLPEVKALLSLDPFTATPDQIETEIRSLRRALVESSGHAQKRHIRRVLAGLKLIQSPTPMATLHPTRTDADRERIRNEPDYRPESTAEIVRRL